ncbi:MAG: hypothetical protein PHQ98_01070 [Candidatus ainarchaeum sp.]|nr:hypothetical protein [Candidatus ainarchaeum sp.]
MKKLVCLICLICLISFSFAAIGTFTPAAIPTGGSTSSNPTTTSVVVSSSSSSILFLFNVLHKNLIKSSFAEVKVLSNVENPSIPSSSVPAVDNSANGVYTVKWVNLSKNDVLNTIYFDQVSCGGANHELKINFLAGTDSKLNTVRVFDGSNNEINCAQGLWATLANSWSIFSGNFKGMVISSADSVDSCGEYVCTKPYADVKLIQDGQNYTLEISSPIIPEKCNGLTFNQSNASTNILHAQCN